MKSLSLTTLFATWTPRALVLGSAVVAALVVAWHPLIGAVLVGGAVMGVAIFLWPSLGIVASLLTLVIGQAGRIPVPGSEVAILPNDVLLPLVIVAWLARRLVDRKPMLPSTPLGRSLVLFIGLLMLSFFGAVLTGTFLRRELFVAGLYLVRWVEYLALFFIARTVVRPGTLWRWAVAIGLVATALAVLGFLQLYFIPDFSAYVPKGWDPHVGRLLSTWFDPNFLGGFFAFVIVLFLSLATERRSGRLVSLGIALVCMLALILTFSRSGYAGFLVGFGVLAIVRARHFLSIGILVLLLVFLFVPRVQERVIGIRSIDETAQFRLTSWRNALTVVADHPWLGVGYNTYRYVQVRYGFLDDPALHAAGGSDSSFLTVAVTTGFIGFAAFLLLLGKMLQAAWLAAERSSDSTLRGFGYGVFAGFIALIVHGQFVNGLFFPHLMQVQWIALGLLLGARDGEVSV